MNAPFKELIQVPKSARIPYFDKPPAHGGQLSYLTPEEFKQKFGCDYSESIWCRDNFPLDGYKALPFKEEITIDQDALKRGVGLLRQKANAQLAIGFIDEKVGYGIFALEDIPEDTVLCFYAGTLVEKKSATNVDDYIHGLKADVDVAVSAKEKRGLAGFMQHLPLNYDEMEQFFAKFMKKKFREAIRQNKISEAQIDAVAKQSISHDRTLDVEFDQIKFKNREIARNTATTNVHPANVLLDGVWVQAIMASREIKKNEMVGFTYSMGYWQGCGVMPELFTMKGEILPHDCYTRPRFVPDAHEVLVGVLNKLDPERKLTGFWKLIDAREYSKALRTVCTDKSHFNACNFATALLNLQKPLGIKLDEQPGDAKLAAIHHAAKAGNGKLVKLLEENGADSTLRDSSGKTAADYLAKTESQALVTARQQHEKPKATSTEPKGKVHPFAGMYVKK